MVLKVLKVPRCQGRRARQVVRSSVVPCTLEPVPEILPLDQEARGERAREEEAGGRKG